MNNLKNIDHYSMIINEISEDCQIELIYKNKKLFYLIKNPSKNVQIEAVKLGISLKFIKEPTSEVIKIAIKYGDKYGFDYKIIENNAALQFYVAMNSYQDIGYMAESIHIDKVLIDWAIEELSNKMPGEDVLRIFRGMVLSESQRIRLIELSNEFVFGKYDMVYNFKNLTKQEIDLLIKLDWKNSIYITTNGIKKNNDINYTIDQLSNNSCFIEECSNNEPNDSFINNFLSLLELNLPSEFLYKMTSIVKNSGLNNKIKKHYNYNNVASALLKKIDDNNR